jgi:hypothetical protein
MAREDGFRPCFTTLQLRTTTLRQGDYVGKSALHSRYCGGRQAQITSLLASLPIIEPHEVGYDRANFQHGVDADGNGCDTRREVLKSESRTPVVLGANCAIVSGLWQSSYDGASWSNPSDVDIDHFLPLHLTSGTERPPSSSTGWSTLGKKDLRLRTCSR